MIDAAELRPKVKKCINALNSAQPIVFGHDNLVKDGADEKLYVPGLHGGNKDLMRELSDQIDFDEGGGTYLFSGNRGTGKTTELMRLADLLRKLDCEVFYLNMSEYLNLTMSVEITDFLISVLGGLSEKIEERFGENPGGIGFFNRVGNFLQTNVTIEGISIPVAGAQLKMSMQQDPVFKKKLQEGMRGHVAQLVLDARKFMSEAVDLIHAKTQQKKIVLIVDSVEQLRGVGDSKDIAEIFKSAETLFSGHADKLRFQSLHLVCTVPPYLSALAGNLAALYSGDKIYMLPSVHVYKECPTDGEPPVQSKAGLATMVKIVGKRFPEWKEFLAEEQLLRLAANSGGDLRDFFRMVKLCISQALYQKKLPLPDAVLASAESDLRNDMPLAADDKAWLKKILHSHKRELASLDKLPVFARLTEGKYILNYRNGDDWFDVHPLLRATVTSGD